MENIALMKANRELARLSYQYKRDFVPQVVERECISATENAENVAVIIEIPSPPHLITEDFYDWYQKVLMSKEL